MKFTCNRKILNQIVGNVLRAVSTKSTIPAIEGILIEAENNQITLYGYDLEIGITTSMEAEVSEEGAVVVTAKLFAEIIKKLPDDRISVSADDKSIIYIASGNVDYKIIGIPKSEYPELPTVYSPDRITLDGQMFKSMIRQTMYAVSDKDDNPTQKGSLIEIDEGIMKMVSVDGYRLAVRTEKIEFNDNKYLIVPKKTLQEIINLIGENTGDVMMRGGGRHMLVEIHGYTIISRLIDGEFMNYKSTIPSGYSIEAVVNTRKFIETIERMSLMLSDRIKSPIRCCFENNKIQTHCSTPRGEAYDELEAEINGEHVEIGVDNRYILDALKYAETDEVRIRMNGSLKPIVILPMEGESFIYLVMPVRLKNVK